MASVTKDGSKGWRIRFYDGNGDRQQIRLAGVSKTTAHKIAGHVQVLSNTKRYGERIEPATAAWLVDTPPEIHAKLLSVGLVEEREASTLSMFLKGYLLRRADVKPATLRKWQSAVNHLIEHLGENRDLRSINTGHADEFRSYLYKEDQAENTVRRYCGLAKQFFRAAQRRKLIDENPFSDQVAAVTGNAAKFHFITREDTAKLLKACLDTQWRLIVALTRFGGLRCPSEVLALKWEDIDWQGKRFTVTSPKTEHHEGGASRVVPLFPELAEILNEGYELEFQRLNDESGESVGVVSGPVITRYRDSTQNLRTTFLKVIKRAGLTAWPKLFQNLRSTRETELAEQFPLQAVTAWMGNSQLVAAKHYLQLRDEHFDRASLEVTHPTTKSDAVAPPVAPQESETTETNKPTKAKNPAKLNVLRGPSDSFVPLRERKMGAEGLEASGQNAGQTAVSDSSGPTSGPIGPDLQIVIHAWPHLSEATKRKILREVQRALK